MFSRYVRLQRLRSSRFLGAGLMASGLPDASSSFSRFCRHWCNSSHRIFHRDRQKKAGMLLARARTAALRPGALRGLSQQGQSGRVFAARIAGAHRPQQALLRHRSIGSGTMMRHLSTMTDDGQGTHPRDGRPSLLSLIHI